MDSQDQATLYNFINVGLNFIIAIVALVLAFCSCCMIRKRKDPARTCFTMLKGSLWLFAGYCIFRSCSYAIAAAHWTSDPATVGDVLQYTQAYILVVARLFDIWSQAVFFLTIARLSFDIAYTCNTPAERKFRIGNGHFRLNTENTMKIGTNIVACLLSILAVLEGAFIAANTTNLAWDYESEFFNMTDFADVITSGNFSHAAARIDYASVVILWILGLAMVVRAVLIKIQCRREIDVNTPTTYLLVCAILWLLRTSYDFAYQLIYINPVNGRKSNSWHSYNSVVSMFFDLLPVLISLCILFALGRKKRTGLWSTRNNHLPVMLDKIHANQSTSEDIELGPVRNLPSPQDGNQDQAEAQAQLPLDEQPPLPPLPPRTQDATVHARATSPTSPTDTNEISEDTDAQANHSSNQAGRTSGEQSPFMIIHPRNQGIAPRQTPWGYGYFVPQDPNEPFPQPIRRRSLPDTSSAYDYPMQPPPDYEQHVNDAQHPQNQRYGESSQSPLGDVNDEILGLNHQADGVPPQDSLLQDAGKK